MTVDKQQRIALWRFELIAPLLGLPQRRGELKRAILGLAAEVHEHPFKGPISVRFGTVEEWLYRYRHQGLDGLKPSGRQDHGTHRRIDDLLADSIERLATTRPELDGPGILAEIKTAHPEREPMPSLRTLYRFLHTHGLDQRRVALRRDHRAFVFDLAGDCWQADVMYGPSLPGVDGRRFKTYLVAILDDATRLIAHAQFYPEQHLRAFKDCLKQALMKRGLPRRLYLDNAKVFRSRLVLLIAARLGIHIVHTRPYKPQGRAKLERWFGTVRRSFLARLDPDRIDGLDALNRLLFAWVEGEYHLRPHHGLDGETPIERWMRLSEGLRPLPREVDLDRLFLDQATRRVAKDGTFALHGNTFEAGPTFIAQRVKVHFDPFDLRRVWIESPRGGWVEAFPVDLVANRRLRRNPPPVGSLPAPPAPLRSLDGLAKRLEDSAPPSTPEETSDEHR
jgi:transposase InsO family protein